MSNKFRLVAIGAALELIQLARPLLYMAIINRLTSIVYPSTILVIFTILFVLSIFELLFSRISDLVNLPHVASFTAKSAYKIWPKVVAAEWRFLQKWRSGEIMERLTSLDRIPAYDVARENLKVAIPFAALSAVLIAVINPYMLGVAVMLILTSYVAAILLQSGRREMLVRSKDSNGTYGSVVIDVLQNRDTIRSFSAEGFAVRRIWNPFRKALELNLRLGLKSTLSGKVANFIDNTSYAISICLGSWFILNGTMTVGGLFAYQ